VATAAVPFDWQLTDTYFVVAHLHYVLIGINLFAVIGAFYFWLPKMTGRMLSERLGRWNFWVMFVGFNLAFLRCTSPPHGDAEADLYLSGGARVGHAQYLTPSVV
jgi:heme/copper-type cytochrome/quinol oxidase subunit 1